MGGFGLLASDGEQTIFDVIPCEDAIGLIHTDENQHEYEECSADYPCDQQGLPPIMPVTFVRQRVYLRLGSKSD